jgi:hypothetical protein
VARTFNNTGTLSKATVNLPPTAAPFTVSGWVNPASFAGTNVLYSLNNSVNTTYFIITADSSGVYVGTNTGGTGVLSTAGMSTGVWQHFTGVFASATSRSAYLNGGNKGTDTVSASLIGVDRITLGGYYQTGFVNSLAADIADFGVWNVALTDEEIAALGRGVPPTRIRPSALVAYWPLEATGGYLQNRVRDSASYVLSQNGTAPSAAATNPPTGPAFSRFAPRIRSTTAATFPGPTGGILTPAGSLSGTARMLAQARTTLGATGSLAAVAAGGTNVLEAAGTLLAGARLVADAAVIIVPRPPHVGVIAHKGTDVMEMVTTNLNADMELLVDSGTLVGRSTSQRGDAEIITPEAPLVIDGGMLKLQPVAATTFNQLPSSPQPGVIRQVTDSTTQIPGATVSGGGSFRVLCWFNGANWTVIGV